MDDQLAEIKRTMANLSSATQASPKKQKEIKVTRAKRNTARSPSFIKKKKRRKISKSKKKKKMGDEKEREDGACYRSLTERGVD